MTKTTARYFAREAYRLMLMTGQRFCMFKNGTIAAQVYPSDGYVSIFKDKQEVHCKIRKCWSTF